MRDFCEHDNEPSGSIKCCEILEYLRNWMFLKKGSAPELVNQCSKKYSSDEKPTCCAGDLQWEVH
jgi:hypothetical protein